jgi:cyclophilin family peptidyl-prolyl cis-trans isomerase
MGLIYFIVLDLTDTADGAYTAFLRVCSDMVYVSKHRRTMRDEL